jgi:hypothetical protein
VAQIGEITMSNKDKRVAKLNHDCFNENSNDANYWGGFIACDGYMRKCGRRISITSKDYEHVEKFAKFIGSKNKITVDRRRDIYGIEAVSETICNNLKKKYGVHNKKTYTYTVPDEIKNNSHFWRGCVDADGTIAKNKTSYKLGLAGTKDKCEKFKDFIYNFVSKDIKVSLRSQRLKKIDGFSYSATLYGVKNVKDVCDVLYKNSTMSLDRKLKMYEQIKERYEHDRNKGK